MVELLTLEMIDLAWGLASEKGDPVYICVSAKNQHILKKAFVERMQIQPKFIARNSLLTSKTGAVHFKASVDVLEAYSASSEHIFRYVSDYSGYDMLLYGYWTKAQAAPSRFDRSLDL